MVSYFLPTKALLNNFRKLEELVFFDLWIPDSGFRILDSGFRFRFRIPVSDSGFWFLVSGFLALGLPITPHLPYKHLTVLLFMSFQLVFVYSFIFLLFIYKYKRRKLLLVTRVSRSRRSSDDSSALIEFTPLLKTKVSNYPL